MGIDVSEPGVLEQIEAEGKLDRKSKSSEWMLNWGRRTNEDLFEPSDIDVCHLYQELATKFRSNGVNFSKQ